MTAPPAADVQWISAFLEAQAAELDAARNTQLAYGRDLKDFANWLAHRKTDFLATTRDDVEGYLVSCDAEGLSKATRARRLSSIRQLFRFAHDEGWRADNPAAGFKKRIETARERFLSHEEIARLAEVLDAAEDQRAAIRDFLLEP